MTTLKKFYFWLIKIFEKLKISHNSNLPQNGVKMRELDIGEFTIFTMCLNVLISKQRNGDFNLHNGIDNDFY